MSTTKPTTIRVNESLKDQAVDMLSGMGMSYNSYVVLATQQLVNQRRIPFDIVATPDVPNDATRRALVAAEAKELGLIPDDAAVFTDSKSLMSFLDED